MGHDEHEWVQDLQPVALMPVGSEIEADIVLGVLRSNGLRAFGQNESKHPISHYGGQSGRSAPLSLYRIYVHPDDEPAARELVRAVELDDAGELEPEENDYGELPEEDYEDSWGSTFEVTTAIAAIIAIVLVVSYLATVLRDGGL